MISYEQMTNNQVYLRGVIQDEMILSHYVCGEGFYETFLAIKRLSEKEDIIPITISERLIQDYDLRQGKEISVIGQFRSYNKIVNGKSRLFLTMFVRNIVPDVMEAPNLIYLNAYVCKEPVYRTTPFAREISDVLVAVNRAYNKSDYIPCICWGRNARFCKTIKVGDNIAILGRIQSRVYEKRDELDNVESRVAYEISVSKMAKEKQIAYLQEDLSYQKIFKVFNDEDKRLFSYV